MNATLGLGSVLLAAALGGTSLLSGDAAPAADLDCGVVRDVVCDIVCPDTAATASDVALPAGCTPVDCPPIDCGPLDCVPAAEAVLAYPSIAGCLEATGATEVCVLEVEDAASGECCVVVCTDVTSCVEAPVECSDSNAVASASVH